MKLSISNIGWEQHDDPAVMAGLARLGVQGIEVAPTKIWPEWQGAEAGAAVRYREKLAAAGFDIPAMQAILFGRPELQLFVSRTHGAFLDHMRRVADLAAALGAGVLVFGAPKNRRRGQLSMGAAMDMAADFFRRAGEICYRRGCCLGLEHNPVEYGCDFITNVADARELVDRVDHPGFRLHLDSAGVHMCDGDFAGVIATAGRFVHFHISEPMLEPVAGGVVDHDAAASALRALGYDAWVSIEMKTVPDAYTLYRSVERAISAYIDE